MGPSHYNKQGSGLCVTVHCWWSILEMSKKINKSKYDLCQWYMLLCITPHMSKVIMLLFKIQNNPDRVRKYTSYTQQLISQTFPGIYYCEHTTS